MVALSDPGLMALIEHQRQLALSSAAVVSRFHREFVR